MEQGTSGTRSSASPGRNKYAGASDADLVRGLQEHDNEAWKEFYERHGRLLMSFIRSRAQMLQLNWDDIFQETVIRIERHIGKFELRGERSFRSWYLSIANRLIYDLFRTDRDRPTPSAFVSLDDLEEQLGIEPTVDDDPPGCLSDEKTAIRAAFEKLNPVDQALIDCRVMQALTDQETADRLHLPVKHIANRKYKAMKRLRQLFEGLWPPKPK
jgi:RNA polymerase sigma factor (sigma-70 family)